jgi:CelD/BcsL family acetyltransferase involved in cellulose biosynthesis
MDSPLSLESIVAWEALAATAATLPSQDAPWTLASLAAFPGKANVIERRGPDGCEAVAPLVRRGTMLELPACAETGEPVDFLAASPEAAARLADDVRASGLPLLLERVPTDSPTVAALRDAFGAGASFRASEKVGFPTISLDERWAEPGGGLSSSRRSSLRRGRRKAEKLGEVTIELLSPKPEEVEALLDEAFEVETRSWKGEEGTAVAFVPKMNAFYRAYAAELAKRERFRLDFLRVDGRAVAMQFGAVWRDAHWLFKIGYDVAFSSSSPGQILLSESVAAATGAGLSKYELFGAHAQWTDVWTEDVHPCQRLLVLPRGPRGALGGGTMRGRALQARAGAAVKQGKRKVSQAARQSYVTGPELADALAEVERCRAASYATTVGYWPMLDDSPAAVAAKVQESAELLPAGSEVSIKLFDFGGGEERLEALLDTVSSRELTLHIDALGADTATLAQETAKRLHAIAPGKVGCTLPGRWSRSVADAAAIAPLGLRVRIVKGEFEDPEGGESDLREGFLAVAEALAGGGCHVEVATQDASLARAALELLVGADTSCELQVLYAMQGRAAARAARDLGAPVRVYVPFGAGRLPYTRERLKQQPALLATLARDALPLPPRRPPGA